MKPARIAGLVHLPRQDFIRDYFDYKPGEHVTLLAPTQNGKTTFGFQLLKHVSSDELPAYVLVIKPRDPVVVKWRKELDFGMTRDWPPPRFPKKRGWVIWPKHSFNIKADEAHHSRVMRSSIMGAYARGDSILFDDEIWGLQDLGLRKELTTVHTRASAMGTGQWVASQRPFDVIQTAYSQAEHLFLGPTPDKRDRDRFREIGGMDPALIDHATTRLSKFQFLHIQRTGATLCVVDP